MNMSTTNHFSSNLPQPNWWPRRHIMESFPKTPPSSSNESIHFDLNIDEEIHEIPKLSLFEKPLTPSDVGKLNRLVIPKQFAEKHFPLNAAESGGDSAGKGMLLSFEDELGNTWKFRYSYWNSSQSYVLTKGWSRFVKDKKLNAGDVVLFERHRRDNDRIFIGWRRKKISTGEELENAAAVIGGGGWSRRLQQNYPAHPHAGERMQQSGTSGNSKKLRLFGVNMEYEPEAVQVHQQQTPSDDSGSSACSNPADPAVYQNHYQYYHQLVHANNFNQYPTGI